MSFLATTEVFISYYVAMVNNHQTEYLTILNDQHNKWPLHWMVNDLQTVLNDHQAEYFTTVNLIGLLRTMAGLYWLTDDWQTQLLACLFTCSLAQLLAACSVTQWSRSGEALVQSRVDGFRVFQVRLMDYLEEGNNSSKWKLSRIRVAQLTSDIFPVHPKGIQSAFPWMSTVLIIDNKLLLFCLWQWISIANAYLRSSATFYGVHVQ